MKVYTSLEDYEDAVCVRLIRKCNCYLCDVYYADYADCVTDWDKEEEE